MLAEVKDDPDLRSIPVVVLTTSAAVEDVSRSYDRHANVYVTKPVDFDHFTRVVKQIDDFFYNVAELPPATTEPAARSAAAVIDSGARSVSARRVGTRR